MWYWMNYLTNDEVDGYGVIWTYDQELNEFELSFVGIENMLSWCTLTTDWKTDNMEDGAWGFFVTATYGDEYCSFVEDEGWVYAWLTTDEEGNPLTLEGPYGNQWTFVAEEDWVEYDMGTCENDDSVADSYGDTCSAYYDSYPAGCGSYDTEEFIAARECCACGGGSTGYYEETDDSDGQNRPVKGDR